MKKRLTIINDLLGLDQDVYVSPQRNKYNCKRSLLLCTGSNWLRTGLFRGSSKRGDSVNRLRFAAGLVADAESGHSACLPPGGRRR